jgi:hypothetical protein
MVSMMQLATMHMNHAGAMERRSKRPCRYMRDQH